MKKYDRYFVFDEPIPYKGLLINPVKVKNYYDFFMAAQCLQIEKNKIPDVRIIKMSYLDFLFHLIQNDENREVYSNMLISILSLCLNIKPESIRYNISEKNKITLILTTHDNQEQIIDNKDFDEIKSIILYQNIPSYDDSYIDPKVEAALKEAEEFMNRNKKGTGSLEDQIICIMTGLQESDQEKIHNMTIRKFIKLLQRIDFKLHYVIYKTAEMGGMVSFKEGIEHWMSDLSNKNKYEDLIIDYDSVKGKFNGVT